MRNAPRPPLGCKARAVLTPVSSLLQGFKNMRLYIETMDMVLVDYEPDGRVQLEGEDWSTPTLQERRAILHAAQTEIDRLRDLVLALGTT